MSKILTEQETQNLMEFLGAGIDFNGGQLLEAVQQWVGDSNEVAVLSANVGQIAYNKDRKEFRVFNPNSGNVETLLSSSVILQAIDDVRKSEDTVSEKAVVDYIQTYVSAQLTEKLTGVFDSQGTVSSDMANYPIISEDLGSRIAVWVATANITVKDIELKAGDWLTYNTSDGWGKIAHTETKASTSEYGVTKLASTFDKTNAEDVLTAPLVAGFVENLTGVLEGLISALSTRVTATETGLASLGSRVTTLENKTSALETSQATQDGKISDLETEQGSQATKISSLESGQTAQDTKITSLENGQAVQDGKISTLETSDATQNTKISNLESDVAGAKSDITGLNSTVASQGTKITNLENSQAVQDGKITTVEGKIATAENDIDALEAGQVVQDGKITAVESDVADLKTDTDKNTADIQTLLSRDDYSILATGLTSSNAVFTYGAEDSDFPLANIGEFHIENGAGNKAMGGLLIDRTAKTLTVDIHFPISAGNYTLVVSGQSIKGIGSLTVGG